MLQSQKGVSSRCETIRELLPDLLFDSLASLLEMPPKPLSLFSLSVSHRQRQILNDRGDYKHCQQGGSRCAPSNYICGMTANLLNNLTLPQERIKPFFNSPLQ